MQMNNQRFYDLSFEVTGDGVRLVQNACGDDYIILAHPEQLKFITRRLCGMDEATAAKVQDLERKLSVLTDRLEALVTAAWLRKSIANECDDGVEILAKLDGLVDLAVEMDGGRLLPSDPTHEPSSKNAAERDSDALAGVFELTPTAQ